MLKFEHVRIIDGTDELEVMHDRHMTDTNLKLSCSMNA